MDSDRDLYQILQVDPAAEPEVVQAAFKRLAHKYHPDKNQSLDAHRRMQELNEAYAVIGDPAQRAAYDRQRHDKLTAQRQAEEQARHQAEAERRAEMARQRREQAAAQRQAENERREQARTAAAQRRVEYEQQIRAQMAAQRRAKRERQQREQEAQQAPAQPATPIEMPVQEPAAMPEAQAQVEVEKNPTDMLVQEPAATPQAQVRVEVENSPIDWPRPGESERQQIALMQSRQALQNEIFKLNFGLTDADEQLKYWSGRWFPWDIVVPSVQATKFVIGSAVTIIALLLAGFTLAFGSRIGGAACGLVGISAGWLTWRSCVSAIPVEYFVEAWSEIKRSRELRQRMLRAELAQLEFLQRNGRDS